MLDENWIQWLIDNGHILMLWSNQQNIADALVRIISDKSLATKVSNFYGIDPYSIYWEYNLLPNDSIDKQNINDGTQAKYTFVLYYKNRKKLTK